MFIEGDALATKPRTTPPVTQSPETVQDANDGEEEVFNETEATQKRRSKYY